MPEEKKPFWKRAVDVFVEVDYGSESPPPPSASPPPVSAPPFVPSPVPFAPPPLALGDEPQLSFEDLAKITSEVEAILGMNELASLQAVRQAIETLAANGVSNPDDRIRMAVAIALPMKNIEPSRLFADARAALSNLEAHRTSNRSSMPVELQAITTAVDRANQKLESEIAELRRQIDEREELLRAKILEREEIAPEAERARLRCQLLHQAKGAQLDAQAVLLQQVSTITQDMLAKSASRRTS